jgi:hypothetical protein
MVTTGLTLKRRLALRRKAHKAEKQSAIRALSIVSTCQILAAGKACRIGE